MPSTTSHIRSFVRREGRLTPAQARALDRLWPRFGLDFAPQPIDLEQIFGRRAPLTLEIGFGNGEALAALAARQRERNFIGIEVHRPGVGRLLNALESDDLDNVRVISHDAVEVIDAMLPVAAVDQLLIYFPDPWPKKRHHKRRLIQPAFVAKLARIVKPGGRLELATDWEDYAVGMLETLNAAEDFVNLAAGATYAPRAAYRPETRFERRGTNLGHRVRDLVFQRR
ncbi:MAG TPA: tRNA (guanosine(46)-N7)-methyltransferase TrmB [Gammaproteobacteria bacterium]|nr:tRNA (guanosine(46)-N7)-methyltransferase TrmB [Gammaproteobacteria bacterium]